MVQVHLRLDLSLLFLFPQCLVKPAQAGMRWKAATWALGSVLGIAGRHLDVDDEKVRRRIDMGSSGVVRVVDVDVDVDEESQQREGKEAPARRRKEITKGKDQIVPS